MHSLFRFCVNGNLLSVTSETLELHLAVNEREQSVIGADAYVVARVNVRAALSYENVARENELSVSALYTQSLGLGISTVLGRTHTFFMSEIL